MFSMTVHDTIEDSKRSQLKHVICANRGKIRVPQVTTGVYLKLFGWDEIVFIVIGYNRLYWPAGGLFLLRRARGKRSLSFAETSDLQG